ncbi:MAG: sulfatase-like hydrolase/transferase [Oscillospiraceae bacterium]|nr:sulfatase-like hydrolase/transferase [Oscillospiraceae bacterium]
MKHLSSSNALKNSLTAFAYWLFAIVFFETLLHAAVFAEFAPRFAFVVGFSIPIAAVITLFTGFLPRKASFPVSILLTVLLIFLYGSQIVYNAVFGSLYSLAMMALGGDALGAFWKETFLTMTEHLLPLALLFVPLVVLIVMRKLAPHGFDRSSKYCRLGLALTAVAVQVITVCCLFIGGTGYFTNHYFYNSVDTTTDQAADRFGLLTAMRLELTVREDEENGYYAEQPQEEVEEVVEYNVLELDFDHLNTLTENKKQLAINDYCASLTGTNKNEYTGMLSDYNLIVLCGESFSTAAIDPVLTPTLYKLANEGIIFNNYYNTYPNTTTDGEYSLCFGLYPDTSRGKSASSFYASRGSYLPFTLGNIFMEQKGIQCYGYHNYYGSYYGRNQSHPNIGYQMKFAGSGMRFTNAWPASDLEMMEQSIDDYLGQDQFHAYYMTFSGHYKYDRWINGIAELNWDLVKDLEYSDPAKAFLSCNIELDKAVAYLLQRLEDEGVADKTAIVLAGDHFPYGLTDAQYSELIGYEIDRFSKYKSTLIFWVGGLEENIVVDEYCCNVDILPTILNLWGFDYDSRMLAGTDVFSDGEHVAVLIDKSFYTDKVWLNASSGEIRYLVPEDRLPAGYVDNMIQMIKTKFTISSDILTTAYYNLAFGKDKVWVNNYGWQ